MLQHWWGNFYFHFVETAYNNAGGDKMNYKDYQNSRDLAWEILIREKISRLPVRVTGLCTQLGIETHLYTPRDRNDGYSIILNGTPRIFISDRCSRQRQRFTAAHELGHILLGHVGQYELVNREPSRGDNPIEQAANVFAARLLAPACVLWALDARTPEQIARICDISLEAAQFRAERMELLYRRNKFLTSPLERQVYEQFQDFIRSSR
jgi:Zn-dependent peptidase ImmA (M78 family)